jgi:nucleoporin GLE1
MVNPNVNGNHQINTITAILNAALTQIPSPAVDVRQFIFSHNQPSNPTNTTLPGLYLYLINIFSKAILAQFLSEASVSTRAADPVGIIAVQIFATKEFAWNNVSLMDIMMCKFHLLCPVLWGIYGPETTNLGKARLGWWREAADGPWITEQRHSERMTGLGAGFAAISSRNFAKSSMSNPCPNYYYWQALHYVTSPGPKDATPTHFVVLKALVENSIERLLDFYGDMGKAALRYALVDYPAQGGPGAESVAARAVATIPDVLRRDKRLFL